MSTALMHTPYFPTLRSRLAALGRRTVRAVRQMSLPELGDRLQSYLPAQLLSSEEDGPNSRDVIYSLRLTFQCFVWQMLKPRTACREVVRQVQTLFCLKARRKVDEGTSAFCQARQRLPVERLEKAVGLLAQRADRLVRSGGQLQGRPVKVVDATGVQLADTAENQERYPQSPHQRPGCGFPIMKLLALFSLASGSVVRVATGNLHDHDLRLLRKVWEDLKRGEILLGDRHFGDYTTLADGPRRGVDVVSRLNAQRKVDFRKAKRLGRNDGLFDWKKPPSRPPYLSQAEWEQIPQSITVRVIRFQIASKGCRTRTVTLVTTLLDPKLYPLEELAALYARRWRLELCFRDLKPQMGMDQLRCQTPEMAEKEALAYLVAHNLVRCIMAEASASYDVELERLSFKGTGDALRQFMNAMAQARSRKMRKQLWDDLLRTIAFDRVPLRPGRREPRAVKRRPKPYPRLIVPRRQFKDPLPYRKWLRRKRASKIQGLI